MTNMCLIVIIFTDAGFSSSQPVRGLKMLLDCCQHVAYHGRLGWNNLNHIIFMMCTDNISRSGRLLRRFITETMNWYLEKKGVGMALSEFLEGRILFLSGAGVDVYCKVTHIMRLLMLLMRTLDNGPVEEDNTVEKISQKLGCRIPLSSPPSSPYAWPSLKNKSFIYLFNL